MNDLFAQYLKPVVVSVEERMDAAIAVLFDLFMQDTILTVSFSSGKDSVCLLMLTLMAAEKAVTEGKKPVLWIQNADTGVENPLVSSHARTEMRKAKAYAKSKGITVQIAVASPNLLSSWLIRVVGGRALPSFPQANADCSIEWKQVPMQSMRKKLLARLNKDSGKEPVTLTGSRFAESASRSGKMRARGETATTPFRNKAGELVLSPICMWSDDDVWEVLGMVRNGMIQSYTDAEDLHNFYRDAGPTSCAVVNDAILEGGTSSRGGCGARSGCWCCVQVASDTSMENLLDKPEYEFMRGLNDLREFIANTQHDMNRRQWIGRSIRHGYFAVQPDALHPSMLRELFRYVLTVQMREEEDSSSLGIYPRFQLVTPGSIVALDAMWSLQGYHPPFTALEDYRDIVINGVRYDIPKIEPMAAPKEWPEPRFLYVGADWDSELRMEEPFTGLRDPFTESMTELSGCIQTRQLTNGRTVIDIPEATFFSVDEEGASMLLEFELDHLLDTRRAVQTIGGYAQGYLIYAQYGCLTLASGQSSSHDRFLRRTSYKERHGLCGPDYDKDALLAASVPWHEAPLEVQEAFIGEAKLKRLRQMRQQAQNDALQQALCF